MTGGIGAGKSEALRAFARHGAAVISSDEIVHDLLRSDEGVRTAVRERWGDRVFTADGEVDRARIARIVFHRPDELRWLEGLLHPRVIATYLRWRDDLRSRQDPPDVCVTEVPLLYEVGGEKHFDVVVVVTAPPELRTARRLQPQDDRELRLIPDAEKAARADYAYVNDGTLEELDAFVGEVMEALAS